MNVLGVYMDESTVSTPSLTDWMPDGFPGQRMRVLPRPLISRAVRVPPLEQILVTDVGFFPRASRHGRNRPHGAEQTIVIVCAAGSGACRLASRSFRIRSGQAVIIPPGIPHDYEADNTAPWTIWWFHVIGNSVAELVQATRATQEQPVVTLGDPTRVISLIETAIHRMERDETLSTMLATAGAAWNALALIGADRRYTTREQADPITAVIEHLQSDITSHTTVAELAGMAGLSTSHFAARFRRMTGFGVLEYQTRQRMSRARELLSTTDRTVASIASEVGYSDSLYFSRQFHHLNGVTPSAFRRSQTGE